MKKGPSYRYSKESWETIRSNRSKKLRIKNTCFYLWLLQKRLNVGKQISSSYFGETNSRSPLCSVTFSNSVLSSCRSHTLHGGVTFFSYHFSPFFGWLFFLCLSVCRVLGMWALFLTASSLVWVWASLSFCFPASPASIPSEEKPSLSLSLSFLLYSLIASGRESVRLSHFLSPTRLDRYCILKKKCLCAVGCTF